MSTTGIATKKSHDNDTTARANISATQGASNTPAMSVNSTLRRIVTAHGSSARSCGHAARRQTAVSRLRNTRNARSSPAKPEPALVVDDDPAQVVEHAERRWSRDLRGETERRRGRERVDEQRFDDRGGGTDDDEILVPAQPLAHTGILRVVSAAATWRQLAASSFFMFL